jgi:hypothetical protein
MNPLFILFDTIVLPVDPDGLDEGCRHLHAARICITTLLFFHAAVC